MILVLVTCINPSSDSSDEWYNWTQTTNYDDSNYLLYASENNKLIVINGEQFDYDTIHNNTIAFINKLEEKLDKIKNTEKVHLAEGDIVAIHYGGGYLSNKYVEKRIPDGHSLEKQFKHTGETYIITDYSLRANTDEDISKRLKDGIKDFWQSSSPQNLKKIFDVFFEKKKQ